MAELIDSLEDWQSSKSLTQCHKFMFQHEINCDVTFLLGQTQETVKAHKYMLICRSSVFQSIFSESIESDEHDATIPVSDINPDTFRALLLYMYCEEVTVKSDNVDTLLYAAKKYAVKGLIEQCMSYLESSLNPQNVCAIIEQVHVYDGKNLEAKCITFIFENAADVLQSKSFIELCSSCVENVVKSDELVLEERQIYEAVLRWAENQCSKRGMQNSDENIRKALGPILHEIRFPLMNTIYFTHNISTREILNSKEVIGIYQCFNGRVQPSNWQFNTSRRRGFSFYSVFRYSLILMDELLCQGQNHAIIFSCSHPVILHGAVVYGCLHGDAVYNIRTDVSCVEDDTIIDSNYLTLSTERSQHLYDVLFSKPIPLVLSKHYCITINMEGPPTKFGFQGKSEISTEGVVFHFTEKASSKTGVEKGQIPGLLFTKPKVA